jgi:hypothetical protein
MPVHVPDARLGLRLHRALPIRQEHVDFRYDPLTRLLSWSLICLPVSLNKALVS